MHHTRKYTDVLGHYSIRIRVRVLSIGQDKGCVPLFHSATLPHFHTSSLPDTTPPTMASQQSIASTEKIANYSQSISSGVTNLLNEFGRVNAVVAFDSGVIEAQLQKLIAHIQGMDTRIAAIEQSLQSLQSMQRTETTNGTWILEIEPVEVVDMPDPVMLPNLQLSGYCVILDGQNLQESASTIPAPAVTI